MAGGTEWKVEAIFSVLRDPDWIGTAPCRYVSYCPSDSFPITFSAAVNSLLFHIVNLSAVKCQSENSCQQEKRVAESSRHGARICL